LRREARWAITIALFCAAERASPFRTYLRKRKSPGFVALPRGPRPTIESVAFCAAERSSPLRRVLSPWPLSWSQSTPCPHQSRSKVIEGTPDSAKSGLPAPPQCQPAQDMQLYYQYRAARRYSYMYWTYVVRILRCGVHWSDRWLTVRLRTVHGEEARVRIPSTM
jgi:hypothetical protein